MDLLAPSQRFDPYWGIHPQRPSYPFSVAPDEKVTRETLVRILRDHYEGTEFDLAAAHQHHVSSGSGSGSGSGPFGNPVRYDGPDYGLNGAWERAISIFRATFSFIAVSRPFLPDEIGGVVWYGQDAPHGSVYVPFWVGIRRWPVPWESGKQSVFGMDSAWWAFNLVNQIRMWRWDWMSRDVEGLQGELEEEIADEVHAVEHEALLHCKKNEDGGMWKCGKGAMEVLSLYVEDVTTRVLESWWQLAWNLVAKYSNGYVTTREGQGGQEAPGYPKEYLETVKEYTGFPNGRYYFAGEEPSWGVHLPEGGRPPKEKKKEEVVVEGVKVKDGGGGDGDEQQRWSIEWTSFVLGVVGGGVCVGAVVLVIRRIGRAKEGEGEGEGEVRI